MNTSRSTAVLTGVLFLLTEVGAIVGAALYRPLLGATDYITGTGADTSILLGALFELILVVAAVGTAVTLYPILKRHNDSLALAYVTARVLEAAVILIGMLTLLSIVTLRRQFAGSADVDEAALKTVGSALVAVHDWAFLFGPGFALGAGSLFLASLMYSARLIPRPIAALGLVGGTLITLSALAVTFGIYEQMSTIGLIIALPVFVWELSLAAWLIIKGFRPAAILDAHPVAAAALLKR